MNKLGIFGDSFADLNPEEYWDRGKEVLPWPVWLAEQMNKELICKARSCSPIWYAFERFKENFDQCDTIIFVYTNHMRINGLSERYAGLSSVNEEYKRLVNIEEHDVAKIIFEAKKYLLNDDLQLFIYQQVFEKVNQLCLKRDKKLINILPFEGMNKNYGKETIRERYPYFIDFSKSKFPCLVSLFDISAEELHKNYNPGPDEIIDTRHCHISPYNNKIMAKIVQETFNKSSDYIYDLFTDDRFRYDVY